MAFPTSRNATLSWYVELPNLQQIPLGQATRAARRRHRRPPPPEIQKKHRAIMQRQAEPEDRTLGFCIGEYLKSSDGCVEKTHYCTVTS